jgi:hypothetical protein
MPPWTRRSSLVFVALTLLAGLGALLVGESYVHTDDGCAVETHCIACRRAVDSVAVVSAPVALPQVLELLGNVTLQPAAVVFEAPHHSRASRGPPQA